MQNNYFKTTDLNICSYLACFGYYISSTEKDKNNATTFYITRDENLDKLIEQYFSHQAKVDPIIFANNQRSIKSLIYHS